MNRYASTLGFVIACAILAAPVPHRTDAQPPAVVVDPPRPVKQTARVVTLSAPIVVGQDDLLDLTGIVLKGPTPPSKDPFPLVILDGKRATLIGGTLYGTGKGPVVHVKNGWRFHIDGTYIEGEPGVDNIGIQVDSPIGAGVSQQTSYVGIIRDVEINTVGVGIFLTEQANAIHIHNPLVYNCRDAFFRFRGAYGNCILGGFCHGGKHTGKDVIAFELLPKTVGKAHDSIMNVVVGHVAEPGAGRRYVISKGCDKNQFTGCVFNMARGGSDLGMGNEGLK